MTTSNKILLIAISLLITQTAIAVHDIHCLDGEHDDVCKIYLSQDHSAQNNDGQKQLERMPYDENSGHFIARFSQPYFISFYHSRAPPQQL